MYAKTKTTMKTKDIPLIGLEHFTKHPEHVTYMDENIAVIDSLTEIMNMNEETISLDCFMIVFCQEGNITININGKTYLLQKDYCAILPPNTILRKVILSQSYNVKIAAASQKFLNEIYTSTKETWDIIHYLYNNPILPINPKESYKMYLYKELLMTLIQEKPHVYSKQTRRHHFAGMFCEMMAALNKTIPNNKRLDLNRNRNSIITRDFIQLVNADDGSHRSVSYYANRLCYSAKYLSCVIKRTTGKNPLQIINEHTIKEIKFKLKHSDMSIKEIADFFNFPNPSFFGKFVKGHTGMTPLQYKTSEEEK